MTYNAPITVEYSTATLEASVRGIFGGVVKVRRYPCACGAAVRVADDEPLPRDWGVTMARTRHGLPKYGYLCPTCKGVDDA